MDRAKIERIEALRIPPAWKDVWISPRPGAKLHATGSTPPAGGNTSTTPTSGPVRSRRNLTA